MWLLTLIGIAVAFFLWITRGVNQDINLGKAQATALAAIPDFNPVVIYGGGTSKAGIAIDPLINKFALIYSGEPARLFDFDQLIAAEVERNGDSVIQTDRGSQVVGATVGAFLLGPIGLLLGGATGSKRNITEIKRLSLKLYTNDILKPVHEIVFLDSSVGLKSDSLTVKKAALSLDEWYGRFRTVLAMKKQSCSKFDKSTD